MLNRLERETERGRSDQACNFRPHYTVNKRLIRQNVLLVAALAAGVLLASCARNEPVRREPRMSNDAIPNVATLSRWSLLETGRVYCAQVKKERDEEHTNWWVQSPPVLPHYAVGFEWLNLSNINNPREGLWTFTVKSIERIHIPEEGSMGLFVANYNCEVLKIEDPRKKWSSGPAGKRSINE
jgi:hypothetical protein